MMWSIFRVKKGLSRLYSFEITLVSEKPDLDLKKIMESQSVFSILRSDGNINIHGMLREFEVSRAFGHHVFYRAVLAPNYWRFCQTEHNQVFLEKSLPEIIEAVLKDGGLSSGDYELRLRNSYQPKDYVCQYRESHFNFLSRLMEHEGLYYFFEHGPSASKLIITDTKLSHKEAASGGGFRYQPSSGLESAYHEDQLRTFTCRLTPVPKSVQVKDYNYLKPTATLDCGAELSSPGTGQVYLYGENFQTAEQGLILAKIRAEEFQCQEAVYSGSGTTSLLSPGLLFRLENHFRSGFNQKYLVTDVRHKGSQAAYLTAGLQEFLDVHEQEMRYEMDFSAIPAEVQFRPPRLAVKPRFYGSMNAKIDASTSGEYAEVDVHGRYKVILPFDLSGRSDGKASKPLRMMQPYGGSDHGMHFPLHKDTEVLLTFIDGDPDRPIIAGAVPNPNNPSMITEKNQTQAVIQTGGQNRLVFEDRKENRNILMKTPDSNTYLRLGSKNEEEKEDSHEEHGFVVHTEGKYVKEIGSECSLCVLGSKSEVTVGAIEEVTCGAVSDIVGGAYSEVVLGQVLEVIAGIIVEIKKGYCFEVGESTRLGVSQEEEVIGSKKVSIKAGGPSPSIAPGVANAIQLAVSTSSSAKAAAISKDGSQIAPPLIFSSIAAVNTLLTTAMMLFLAKTRIPKSFKSSLEMDGSSIQLESPEIKLDAEKTDISLKAKDNIKLTAKNQSFFLSEKAVSIQSEKDDVGIRAKGQVVVEAKEDHLRLYGGKNVLLKADQKNIFISDQVEMEGNKSVKIKTDDFQWSPVSAGRFKAGSLEIDTATGQVKIG